MTLLSSGHQSDRWHQQNGSEEIYRIFPWCIWSIHFTEVMPSLSCVSFTFGSSDHQLPHCGPNCWTWTHYRNVPPIRWSISTFRNLEPHWYLLCLTGRYGHDIWRVICVRKVAKSREMRALQHLHETHPRMGFLLVSFAGASRCVHLPRYLTWILTRLLTRWNFSSSSMQEIDTRWQRWHLHTMLWVMPSISCKHSTNHL